MTSRPTVSAEGAFAAARVIGGSLIAGVTTFAVVAWVLGREAPAAAAPADANLVFYGWLALTLGSLVASLFLWRINVAPRIEASRRDEDDPARRAAALQTGLIICWALVEGPALLGVVVYYLYGTTLTLAAGLLTVWVGIGLSWPRREWFR